MHDESTGVLGAARFDLKMLYDTSRLVSSSLDMEFVLSSLLLTSMSKLLVMRGAALIFDPLQTGFRVTAIKGFKTLEKGDIVRIESSIAPDSISCGDQLPGELSSHGLHLMAPLTFSGRLLGVIALGPKATGKGFDDEDIAFVNSLVNMSSAAVHNSLIVDDLKTANRDLDDKIQQLNTLFDISQEFNATVDRERLVKLFSFALMGQMLVSKHLFLLRRDDDPDTGEPIVEIASSKGLDLSILRTERVHQLCAVTSLVILRDGAETTGDGGVGFMSEFGIELIMPIRHQGETCGMLCLGSKMSGKPYAPDEVEFLYALGNLAFVAIQNSFLIEEQIEKEWLEQEMKLAREIQEKLQPQQLPVVEGLELAYLALPSRHVAGDYLDMFTLDDERLLIAIADVTGKGVPASLLMSNLQACIHVMRPMDVSLREATQHINRVICGNTNYDKFITFVHGIYCAADRRFTYVNAGHNPPMLVRASGDIELLETGGLLLGVMSSAEYEEGTVTLEADDVLVLFTDGVTEAMSPDDEEFTEERLEQVLRSVAGGSAQEILDAVQEAVRKFTDYAPQLTDDMTLMVLKAV